MLELLLKVFEIGSLLVKEVRLLFIYFHQLGYSLFWADLDDIGSDAVFSAFVNFCDHYLFALFQVAFDRFAAFSQHKSSLELILLFCHKLLKLRVKVVHKLSAFFNFDAGHVQFFVASFYLWEYFANVATAPVVQTWLKKQRRQRGKLRRFYF